MGQNNLLDALGNAFSDSGVDPMTSFDPDTQRLFLYNLLYAFNREYMDAYERVVVFQNPVFCGYDSKGYSMNMGFYGALTRLHREYGDMKIGYLNVGGRNYRFAPYLDNYGYFRMLVNEHDGTIKKMVSLPFEEGNGEAPPFIKVGDREPDDLFDYIPKAVAVKALEPAKNERFALRLDYDNGESRKYVLHLFNPDEADNETVMYGEYSLTDEIWRTASLSYDNLPYAGPSGGTLDRFFTLPHWGPSVVFSNGFLIPVMRCYDAGE